MFTITKGQPVKIILMLLGSLSFGGRPETGCNSCAIEVLFQGVYTDETCVVAINGGTEAETVTLPTLSIRSLDFAGAEAGSRQFTVTLKECPGNRTVSVTFVSNLSLSDAATGNLINASGDSYSNNVQIRLRKENGDHMAIGNTDSAQDYQIPSSGEEVSHYYFASYYAKTAAVTAGSVKTMADIELVYK